MKPNPKNFLIDLNNFEMGDLIGSGLTSNVFIAENKDTKQLFALKRIQYADFINGKMISSYLNREISIMSRIHHPFIVQFYGYNISNSKGQNFGSILMQYCPKGSLKVILFKSSKNKKIPGYNNTTRQKILIGVARAMQYLHKNHIIHRDLKPGNILLDEEFNPLITDFGFSKIISKKIAEYKELTVTGTPLYEAPEVRDKKYDGKVDVFSFGILMYQIITDQVPYKEFCEKHPNIEPDAFLDEVSNGIRPIFKKDINPNLKQLIEKCWSKEPTGRPTFEYIYKKLAYGSDDSVYGEEFSDENDANYFLDDVDLDEIHCFVNSIKQRENFSESLLRKSIEDIRQQVESLKQETEMKMNQIHSEFVSFRTEIMNQLQKKSKSRIVHPNFVKTFKKVEDFNGIFNYYTQKVGNNLHDSKLIKITTNSQHIDDSHFFFKDKDYYHPKNLLDFNKNNIYKSNDQGGAFVLFDFKERLIKLSMYEIQTCSNSSCHLKNWVIEVSNDCLNWKIVDSRIDEDSLNKKETEMFQLSEPSNEFVHFVRLRQTGPSWCTINSCNVICINKIEFYGQIQQQSEFD